MFKGENEMRLGKVKLTAEYVVNLDDEYMVEEAKTALYEDIMNFVKYDELQNHFDVVEDPTSKEDDIADFLQVNTDDYDEELEL